MSACHTATRKLEALASTDYKVSFDQVPQRSKLIFFSLLLRAASVDFRVLVSLCLNVVFYPDNNDTE